MAGTESNAAVPTPANVRHALRTWCIAVLAGAGLGMANSMTNVFGSPYGPYTQVPGEGVAWLQLLSTWLGSMWAWALFPFAVGWTVRRPLPAVLGGTTGLLAAVGAYYVSDASLGMTAGIEVEAMTMWTGAAALGAPILALIGSYARGTGLEHLLAGLVAPGLMVYVVRRGGGGSGPTQPWSNWAVLLAAGVLTVVFFARFVTRWRARLGSGVKPEATDQV